MKGTSVHYWWENFQTWETLQPPVLSNLLVVTLARIHRNWFHQVNFTERWLLIEGLRKIEQTILGKFPFEINQSLHDPCFQVKTVFLRQRERMASLSSRKPFLKGQYFDKTIDKQVEKAAMRISQNHSMSTFRFISFLNSLAYIKWTNKSVLEHA